MEAALRFFARRPPRSGWPLFGLALVALLMPALLVLNSQQPLSAAPTLFASIAGLVLGGVEGRRLRIVLLIAALCVPLGIFSLTPPLGTVAGDLRALLTFRGPRPSLQVPAVFAQNVEYTRLTLQAAWRGDLTSLNWAIERLCALFSYLAALVLGNCLRRGTPPLAHALPLVAAIVTTGITVRGNSLYTLVAVLPALLVCVVGDFARRERKWERTEVDYSGLLRGDVTAFGGLVLAGSLVLALLLPALPGNALTRWIWAGVELPAGLARLERAPRGFGNGAGAAFRIGDFLPGQSLELGRSIQQGSGEDVAFEVTAPGLDAAGLPYWRGRVLDEYTGQSWTTGPIRNVAAAAVAPGAVPPDVTAQHVRDQRPGPRLRYGLADIVAIDTGSTYEQDTDGTTAAWIGDAQRYTVYSRPPRPLELAGPEALEAERLLETFLVLPDTLPPRVGELAQQLTANAVSQTARAEAIERYLRALPYSYEVARLPPDVDAVDQFLFEMRAGYCTYYASAMAIMARAAGIPSRVAVGYASGEYDAELERFVVREADAHAWPELYIDGQGWTRWEPTPIRPVPARSTAQQQPRPSSASLQPQPEAAAGPSRWWAIIVPAAGLLALVAAWNLRRLLVPLTPARVHADMLRWGRRAGVDPRPADSIEEYAGRLARSVPAIEQPLGQVARLLTARTYRERPLDSGEEHGLVEAWKLAREHLRHRRGS